MKSVLTNVYMKLLLLLCCRSSCIIAFLLLFTAVTADGHEKQNSTGLHELKITGLKTMSVQSWICLKWHTNKTPGYLKRVGILVTDALCWWQSCLLFWASGSLSFTLFLWSFSNISTNYFNFASLPYLLNYHD